ncbi:MAG: MmcQ/YjbR family DNA-binding protein [Ignavibacteria bacterium]|nr:MmcQ/YjbR family DNA-binding protein [Ignavibacteria bacterium]
MNIQSIREYCLRKSGVTEGFPFTESTLVFRVMDKMFLLAALDAVPLQFNIKCDPATAIELRERYDAVTPGYHMDKRHWITVKLDGSVPTRDVLSWIDASYDLIVGGLSKKLQSELAAMHAVSVVEGTAAAKARANPVAQKATEESRRGKPRRAV